MWSKMRLSLTESARIRPRPSSPDAFWTTPARSPSKTAKPRRISDHPRPDSQWSPQEPGRRKRSGRACARIGAGYGALGHVINLPQWVVSCPNAPRWKAEAARGPFSRLCRVTSGRPGPGTARHGLFSQRYRYDWSRFRSDASAFTGIPRFASVIALLVFHRRCDVWCVWASSGVSCRGVCVVVG